MIKFSIIIVYLIIITYGAIQDHKTRLVDDWISIALYVLALCIAILNEVPMKKILWNSIWLFVMLYIAARIYHCINKDDIGVGGADIKMAPAITLFTMYQGVIPIYIAFLLGSLDGFILRRNKNDITPFVVYYAISAYITTLLTHF